MLFFYCALLSLIQPFLAVELSIYNGFTEVRQLHNGNNEYTYPFTNDEYGNIIDGSISFDGTPFLRQEVYSTSESLKGAKVTVRRSTVCECQTIQAEIVDPNSMLLKNLETGVYFYADKDSVEYTSTRPNNGGTTLMLQFEKEHQGTLSYLMRGITWAPNYDLFFTNNDDSELRSYANIKNNQQREYTVENTKLLGGYVQLASGSSQPAPAFDAGMSAMKGGAIRADGEQKGVYSYTLNDKYTLRPSSSIRLPFIDIVAKSRFYYKTSTSFSTGQYQGVFQKAYDLTPDRFMPGGVITIRDNQVLVGQANLPDVPENYTQTVTVGQDNDVRYLVKGNLTSQSENKEGTVVSQTYELDVQVMNFKNKPVDVELLVQGNGQLTVHNTNCNSANVNGAQLNLPVQLQQGETRQCKLNVTVKLV